MDRYGQRRFRADRRVEQGHAVGRGDRQHTIGRHTPQVGVAQLPGHAAGVRPQAPGQGGTRQPCSTAVLSERVEEGVGRGVVALSRAAEHSSSRREQDERRQVQVLGQLVQVPGRVDLRPEHGVEAFGGQRPDDAVVQDTGHVHHTGQRRLGRDTGQHRRQCLPVSGVTRDDLNPGTQVRQLGLQLTGARGLQTTTTGQHHTTDAVFSDQMPGEQRTQRSRTTGDQHRTRGIPHRRTLGLGRNSPNQPRHGNTPVPDRQLRLTRSNRRGNGVHRGLTLIKVEEYELVRVLALGGTQQTPYRGTHRVQRLSRHRNGTASRHYQLRPSATLIGQPGLNRLQHPAHHGTHRSRHIQRTRHAIRALRARHRKHHTLRHLHEVTQHVRSRRAQRRSQRHVIAQHRPRTRHRARAERQHRPLHPEERIPVSHIGVRELLGGDRLPCHRVRRGHQAAGLVRRGQRIAGTGLGQPHPQRHGADRMQPHPGPGDRQPQLAGHRLQGRVQQSRMQPELARLVGCFFGKRNLGEDFIATTPHRAHAAEHRPVPEAGRRQLPVEPLHGDGFRVGRWPYRRVEASGG